MRLPSFVGVALGYFADFIAIIIRPSLPISSIRVKKFMGTTRFSSSISALGFIAPISLEEGLSKTLRYEFMEDNSNSRTFEMERKDCLVRLLNSILS